MRFLLAGGGTGGHVNPLLALAELLRADGHEVVALGTKEGLEKKLVPERGFRLETVARLPLPRKLSAGAILFPFRLIAASLQVASLIRKEKFSAVVGFGGYASAPAYLAAFLTRTPLVIHEANAIAGFANRLGARFTKYVAVCFPNTNLSSAAIVGMPLRREFAKIVAGYDKGQARVELGLDPSSPTLLVTGGSQGAKSPSHCWRKLRAQRGGFSRIYSNALLQLHGSRNRCQRPGGFKSWVINYWRVHGLRPSSRLHSLPGW